MGRELGIRATGEREQFRLASLPAGGSKLGSRRSRSGGQLWVEMAHRLEKRRHSYWLPQNSEALGRVQPGVFREFEIAEQADTELGISPGSGAR